MLEKKRRVILISKLRAILLMEADFNFANKTIIVWRMMHFAKDRNDIAGECASSHQHHKAMDVALNHHLFCDIACLKKCSEAITGADLVQCYDRITQLIASMGSQCWGVPVNVIMCLLTKIQLWSSSSIQSMETPRFPTRQPQILPLGNPGTPTHIKFLVKVMVGDLFYS
jgi:hypothetical protein